MHLVFLFYHLILSDDRIHTTRTCFVTLDALTWIETEYSNIFANTNMIYRMLIVIYKPTIRSCQLGVLSRLLVEYTG